MQDLHHYKHHRLIQEIRARTLRDVERNHVEADELLPAFVDDPTVRKVWDDIERWYA